MFLLLFVTTLFNQSYQAKLSDENIDKTKVEESCLIWADSTFSMHENHKFTFFKAFYTDEYFIHEMRSELYKEKIELIDAQKKEGTFKGSELDYQNDRKALTDAYERALNSSNNFKRAEHYITHFWTNIKTNDGITVYYELILKLDNDYRVIEALENSSIGKKGDLSRIAYTKKDDLIRVVEKK